MEAICNSASQFAEFLETEGCSLRKQDKVKVIRKTLLDLPHAPICRISLPGISRPFSPELAAKLRERGQKGLQGSIAASPIPLIPEGSCECPLKPEYDICFCNNSDKGSCNCGQPWSAASLEPDQRVSAVCIHLFCF